MKKLKRELHSPERTEVQLAAADFKRRMVKRGTFLWCVIMPGVTVTILTLALAVGTLLASIP